MSAGKVGHECISGKFVVCYSATAAVIVTVLRKTSIGNDPNFASRRNGYSF